MFSGIVASSGIAIGKAFVIEEAEIKISDGVTPVAEVDAEIERFLRARENTVTQLEAIRDRAAEKLGEEEAEVFDGHILVATDEELEEEVAAAIRDHKPADFALHRAIESNAGMLAELDDPYLRERATDVRDVGRRMLKNLLGLSVNTLDEVEEGSIIVADDLTPSDTSQIDLNRVWGFITNLGGRTSHSAIMARSLELPAIVGSSVATQMIKTGDTVILDAVDNKILVNPAESEVTHYKTRQQQLIEEQKALSGLRELPCETLDGKRFELCANIGTIKDLEGVHRHGAEGVGLYRTEFLFMDRNQMPTEEEQFESYKAVAESVNGPVIIRTLDIGGDKDLPYMDMPHELNPFLGWRAIRMCFDRPEILNTQLRAILRASLFGQLKIMFPMVISVKEARRLRELVKSVKTELIEEGIAVGDVDVGIMVETPAAVMIADLLIEEVDFFSIGTNDLTQYMLAVDRGNESISELYEPYSPSVIRSIKRVIDCSHKAGKWTGVCGELSGDERYALLLAGMGLDEFSMSAPSIPKVKKALREQKLSDLEQLVADVISQPTVDDVKTVVDAFVVK